MDPPRRFSSRNPIRAKDAFTFPERWTVDSRVLRPTADEISISMVKIWPGSLKNLQCSWVALMKIGRKKQTCECLSFYVFFSDLSVYPSMSHLSIPLVRYLLLPPYTEPWRSRTLTTKLLCSSVHSLRIMFYLLIVILKTPVCSFASMLPYQAQVSNSCCSEGNFATWWQIMVDSFPLKFTLHSIQTECSEGADHKGAWPILRRTVLDFSSMRCIRRIICRGSM